MKSAMSKSPTQLSMQNIDENNFRVWQYEQLEPFGYSSNLIRIMTCDRKAKGSQNSLSETFRIILEIGE